MSLHGGGGDPPMALPLARLVDASCCRFEAAWKAAAAGGDRPRLEAYLGDLAAPARTALVRELLRIDIFHRLRAGDEPRLFDYLGRCPGVEPGWLHEALATELASARGDSPPPRVNGHGGSDVATYIDRSARPVPAMPARDEPTVPGFESLGVLGRGGMGVVYKARQVELNRVVALKMILPGGHTGTQQRLRFRREAAAVAQLQHAHIVQIHEVGEHDGRPYLVLEFVDGGSLDQRLAGTPQPAGAAARLVETLARTVHHAHERGVLHRDLKPGNVLLSFGRAGAPGVAAGRSGVSVLDECVPKLTDFGLAKLLGDDPSGPTRSGEVLGTPSYMAPEQAEGKPATIGPATDVYGLGAILYELLTGRPPFKAATALDTLYQVRSEDPVSPSRLQPRCPRDLVTICLKCLSKEPRLRYATAAGLADDLRRFLDGQTIQARPAGPIERGAKWARRRPAWATLMVTLPLVVALGVAGIVWQWRATARALGETREEQRKTLRARQAEKAQFYLNQVSLAWSELRSYHGGRAAWLLQDTDPALRRWEWHYLHRQAETDLFTLTGHSNEIQAVAWSRDGRWLASGSGHWTSGRESELRLWDARTGEFLRTLSRETGTVHHLDFSPDGRLLASGSHDRIVRLWDPHTGQLVRELPGHTNWVSRVAFSPDGKRLASAGVDNTARLWDVETGRCLHVLTGHKENIFSLAFSPDGKWLVTGDRAHVAHLWDPVTGELLRSESGPGDLRGASFSPDGAWLAFGTFSGSLWIWDMTRPDARPVTQHLGAGSIYSVSFSPDGRRLAWSASNGSIKVRDVRAGRDVQAFRGNTSAAASVVFSPDGRKLAAGGMDHIIRIWDATIEGEPTWTVSPSSATVCSFTFEPDGRLVAVGSTRTLTCVWDVLGKKTLLTRKLPAGPATAAVRSRDGRFHAWIGDDNRLRVVDIPAGRTTCDRDVGAGPVTALDFSFDSRRFAWGDADGRIHVCEAADGREVAAVGPHPARVTGLAFHPDGRRLVSVIPDASLFLWDTATSAPPVRFGRPDGSSAQLLEADREPARTSLVGMTRLAFSPDGLRLTAANLRRPLEIWDMTTLRIALTLDWDGMAIHSAGWSSDGRRLAIGRANLVRILETAELSREARRRAAADGALAWHAGQARQSLNQRLGYAALFHFDRVVEAEPAAFAHREGRARALAELGRWPEAIAECNRAIELGDDRPVTAYRRAVLALQVGDRAAYRQVCAQLIDRCGQPNDVELFNNAAWTCSLADGAIDDPRRAVTVARRAVKLRPDDYALENTLATALYRAGEPWAAIDRFERALSLHELKQGNVQDWVFLAMAHAGLGQREQADAWLRKAMSASPQADWNRRVEMRLWLEEAARRVAEAGEKAR